MKYIKLVISLADEYQEALIAELFDMGFDGFEQRDDQIITYTAKENFSVGDRERMDQLLAGFPGNGFIESEEIVADQNWNEQWEETISAQTIGRFYVKPTWDNSIVPPNKILLEIDPKMSFGTGYHETTRLMLRFLPDVLEEGDHVIDAGTGTGILSIAAIKLGAESAFAFDIDEWSINNTLENIILNGVSKKIIVEEGSSEVIPEGDQADVILVNIQKNIIMDLLPDFMASLKEDGDILLSGLLEEDKEEVVKKLQSQKLEIGDIRQENEWIAIHARR
jgi:ribosomal protein L11 methyltransferase